MSISTPETDVLIVGAGPVGLFLAHECARRGLRWRLIEARARQSEHSKALAVMPRTLEILDMAGIVEPFLQVANRVDRIAILSGGRQLAQIAFAPPDTPYPFVAMVPQDETERLLVGELIRGGGAVEYETRFIAATQHAEGVAVELEHQGQPRSLTARYVVGCDGAHSAVRHCLALAFDGAAYDAAFMLADVETDDAFPADEMQLCPSASGPLAVFPMSATRRRIVAAVDRAEGEAPSLQVVQQALAARGPGILARRVHWSSYFRIHHRQAAQLRVGRIFIAGDAAHIHSPIGGQGMNTGLQDAWNLAWKLDFAVRGRGGERLLDSYAAERLPVIRSVIATTHLMTQAMATPSAAAQRLRDTVIPIVTGISGLRRSFVRRLSQLGVQYRGSPVIEGKGQRFFGAPVRDGRINGRFLLLVGATVDAAAAATLHSACADFGDCVELHRGDHRGILLVRPDGYVAFSSGASQASSVIPRLRAALHTQAA